MWLRSGGSGDSMTGLMIAERDGQIPEACRIDRAHQTCRTSCISECSGNIMRPACFTEALAE